MRVSRTSSALAVACACTAWVLISEQPAYAYIDPGSGSLIYQTILTLLLGAGFVFRRAFSSIGRLFRGREHDSSSALDQHRSDNR
jgi:hypothetical protein